MAPIDITRRWKYLEDGATIAGSVAFVAQHGKLEDVATAVRGLHRDQLEAALFALALIHAHEYGPVDGRQTCVVVEHQVA